MRWFRFAVCLCVGWLVVALPAFSAQDSLTIATNHYAVAGSTLSEIRNSINLGRPGGVRATNDALTTWKINWRTRVSTVNGQCQLDALTVETTISITLPSWRPPTNAAPQVLKRWLAYYTALQRHELNHAESGKRAARELRRRIEEIPSQADCSMLQAQIQAVADEVIAEYKRRDEDYDRETGHGAKEGARLP
jgi:predicted secreted Zn-dependent protease